MISEGSYTDPDVMTFGKMNLSRFSQHFSFRMDSIIPFFCGDSELCRTLGSEEALTIAKINIKNKVSCTDTIKRRELAMCTIQNGMI